MVSYIGMAPVVGAFTDPPSRRAFLVRIDSVWAASASRHPLVNQVWQVYVLICVLHSASVAFMPTFEAKTPNALPDEGDYTCAL